MIDKQINIKVKTEADSKEVEDLQTHLEDVAKTAEETGESLTKSLDESSDSAENLESDVENVNVAVVGISDENFKQMTNTIEETDDAVQELQRDLEDVDKSMQLNDAGMYLQTADQLRAYGSEIEGFSEDIDEAQITLGQLAIQTNMTESAMTNMIATISNETFPKEEAMLYVKSLDQMGVSSENLGKSATDLDKINDAFGMGAEKVNSLGQEMSVLGVDMNNVSSSFNALAYANDNTVGGMQNFYGFFRKYDAQLNELGYDMDQTALIISATTQKYGGGRAALGGLSTALKEADGDTRKLEEALDMEAGSLDRASEITGQYEGTLQTLADEEMEHKTLVQRMGAAWDDFTMYLAPVISPLGSVIGLVGELGSFTLGINGIISLAETFGILNKANLALIPSQIAEGIAGMASIAWVLIAVAVILILVGVLWYLYNNNEQVRQAIDNFAQTLQYVGGVIYSYFITALNNLINVLNFLWNGVQTVINGLINAVNSGNGNILQSIANVLAYLFQLPSKISTVFINIIAKTLGFGDNFVQRMQQAATNSVNNFMNSISSLPSKLMAELNEMLSVVSQWASTLPQKFWDAGVDAVMNFLNALDRHSPGIMQRQLRAELVEMGENIPKDGRGLLSNIGQLGSDVVDEFGNPSLELNSNGTLLNRSDNRGVYGNNYFTINIENVDNEERVNEIVEAVRKSLAWSNTTAGRTV